MAMLIDIAYPGGERLLATGYPDRPLIVQIVPRGPEAMLYDVVEVDFAGTAPFRVQRVIDGPRRPTVRITLDASEPERDTGLDARELEGWYGRGADDGSGEIWIVALRDGMDASDLVRLGAKLVPEP
jgi:hypothetical protein